MEAADDLLDLITDPSDRKTDRRWDRRRDRDLGDPVGRALLAQCPVRHLLEGRRADDELGQGVRVDLLDHGRDASASHAQRLAGASGDLFLRRGVVGRLVRSRRDLRGGFLGSLHETHGPPLPTTPADGSPTGRTAAGYRQQAPLPSPSSMPTRQTLPSDDLYARLGIPRDASPEAIELAWRALLRRPHPGIAGPDGLELAKRINVAHDWLSDPDLRRRYDRERSTGVRAGRPPRAGADWGPPVRRTVRRPPTTAELVASVVERVGRLTRDELDRLALAEPAPIAFLATLRQVVPPDLERQLDDAERAALANLPPAARRS